MADRNSQPFVNAVWMQIGLLGLRSLALINLDLQKEPLACRKEDIIKLNLCNGFAKSIFMLIYIIMIYVWTEPLRLDLLGPGNDHVAYLNRFHEPEPKNLL